MKKAKLLISLVLSSLLVFQVVFTVSAGNISSDKTQLDSFDSVHQYVYNTPIDDTPRILDSESSLLPQTNTRANPTSVDLSASQYFPPVGDQWNLSTCSSWAAAYYQFGYQVASKYSLNVLDTDNRFSPRWVHNIILNGDLKSGASLSKAYDILKGCGAIRYSKFAPADDWVSTENLSAECIPWQLNLSDMEEALIYRVSAYQHLQFADKDTEDTPITSYNSTCLENMKTFLSNGMILTFGSDFGTNNTDWIYDTLSNQTNTAINGDYVCIRANNITPLVQGHAMAIVGYNDNITYDLNGNGSIESFERGAFKIVNSHGTDWMNDGFVWVMYDALNNVSNASAQNSSNRNPVIEDYAYFAINVKEYPRDVIAKVTLNHSDRRQIKMVLGVSDTDADRPTNALPTMLRQNTNSVQTNFSGTGTTAEDATFICDYGDLYGLDTERSNCYIRISDYSFLTGATTVKEVKLIDSTGKTIVLDTNDRIINDETYYYKFRLGIVGDVNNDTRITATDATLIQKHLGGLVTLSDDDLKAADVNGDGKVTASDATNIQKYLAGIITEFTNGSIVLLG